MEMEHSIRPFVVGRGNCFLLSQQDRGSSSSLHLYSTPVLAMWRHRIQITLRAGTLFLNPEKEPTKALWKVETEAEGHPTFKKVFLYLFVLW